MKALSIIIPVLNEAAVIENQLKHLKKLVDNNCEVIAVDGGSHDNTVALCQPWADLVITSEQKGRAAQMNAGAAAASGKCLLFLHSDTQLPDKSILRLSSVTAEDWGFFCIKLSGQSTWFRVIEWCINWRSRISKVATGDQCVFIGRDLFVSLNGYATIPLMEDVEITKRLRAIKSPIIIEEHAITSSRRWEEKGVWQTIVLMWRLRLAYFLGVAPNKLVKRYYPS